MIKHSKHANLERRNNDIFAPNEIAILGSNCGVISQLVQQISKKLATFKLAYFDASHAKNTEKNTISEFTFHHQGNLQITTNSPINKFEQRLQFLNFEMVFINGNHYQGTKQILILDEEKEASVLKRIEELDNIQFVISLKKNTKMFTFLEEKYPEIKNLKRYFVDEITEISNHIEQLIIEKIAVVKGLVLVGGKSTRMGMDKSELDYFGKPQKEIAKELLTKNGLKAYFSVREITKKATEIHDVFLNLGPFGGICSAFQNDPNSAWLVLATDLPFVDEKLIEKLLKNRNPSKVATAIKGKNKQFMEPLITIYEPKAYPILLQYLAQGYSCPRKMLINSDVKIIEVDDDLIENINTKEAYKKAKKRLNK